MKKHIISLQRKHTKTFLYIGPPRNIEVPMQCRFFSDEYVAALKGTNHKDLTVLYLMQY
jgi:hypothetical protein